MEFTLIVNKRLLHFFNNAVRVVIYTSGYKEMMWAIINGRLYLYEDKIIKNQYYETNQSLNKTFNSQYQLG